MILILFLCLIRPSHEYNQIPIIDIPIDFNDTIESILQKVKDKRNNDQNVIDEESYFGNFSKEILLDFKEDEECPFIFNNFTIEVEEELEEETNYSLMHLAPLLITFSISLFPCCCCLSCCCCCCCCSLCRLPERKKAKERENKRNYRATKVKINQDLADDLSVVTKDLLFNTVVTDNTYDPNDPNDDTDNYKEQESYL
jgi:hypothetical protein